MRDTPVRFSPEDRERAARLVLQQQSEHPSQYAAITALAPEIGCAVETLRRWVRRYEQGPGKDGMADARERIAELKRAVLRLRQANEMLRKASAYLAQAELGPSAER
ncbi:transposase [Thiorhodococcus minor]|uniref:Transposase n=1 Tax=Thiorhodococcus minor TaxID=57489 RepID=A0A6M0JZ38_9GAMM|nr:transposase [Thiorhodococcus minor]NEV62756.1 transposase [Thiorhodococcus minor]